MDDKTSINAIMVAIEIYDGQKKGTPHHFGSLVNTLDGRITRNRVSKAVDVLTDISIVKEQWHSKSKTSCYKAIVISTEGIPLVEKWVQELIHDETKTQPNQEMLRPQPL